MRPYVLLATGRLRDCTLLRPPAVAVTAMLIALAGCGGSDTSTGPAADPAGIYTLGGVEYDELPATIHQNPWSDPMTGHFYDKLIVQVTGGVVELAPNGHFSVTLQIFKSGDGVKENLEDVHEGTWTVKGTVVSIRLDNGEAGEASLQEGVFGLSLDYLRKGAFQTYLFEKVPD
jgi:hypothetical protein